MHMHNCFSLQLVQFADSILTISQATASNGRSCTDLLALFSNDDEDVDDDEVKS